MITDKATVNIVFNYYLKACPHRSAAFEEYKKLNTMLMRDSTKKLHRINNTVFLLSLHNTECEFHSMGQETSAFAFIKNIYKLIDYARTLNVSAITTYGTDPVFEKLFQRVSVAATRDIQVGPDGTTYSYYRLEF